MEFYILKALEVSIKMIKAKIQNIASIHCSIIFIQNTEFCIVGPLTPITFQTTGNLIFLSFRGYLAEQVGSGRLQVVMWHNKSVFSVFPQISNYILNLKLSMLALTPLWVCHTYSLFSGYLWEEAWETPLIITAQALLFTELSCQFAHCFISKTLSLATPPF